MRRPDANIQNCSRREFLGNCVLGAAAVGAMGRFAVGQLHAAVGKSAPRFNYKPVAGWARLPKNKTFVGVNGIDVDSRGRVYAAGGNEDAFDACFLIAMDRNRSR